MSQNTDNIALTKQDANENFSRSILNANWDKVDAFAGECINKVQSGVSSISALSNLLDSLLSAMPSNGVKAFQFGFSAVESPFTQATYFGTLYKSGTGTTYSSAVFRRCDQPVTISGARNTNGWSFQQLALNSQIASDWTGCADYKETIESGSNAVLQSFGKLRTLTFQGVSRSHTEDEVLMTLPSAHRPIGGNNVFASGVVNGTPILISLNGSNGQVALFLANSAGTGRIYFNMTWVAA